MSACAFSLGTLAAQKPPTYLTRKYTLPNRQKKFAGNSPHNRSAGRTAAAYRRAEARLAGRHLSGALVTDGYFRMLGVRAALGRTRLPGDASTSAAAVVVLAHTTWQSQFGSASDIVGKKILLRGHPFEVVGVAPPEFTGLGKKPTDFWAPITLASLFDPSSDLFGPSRPRDLASPRSCRRFC